MSSEIDQRIVEMRFENGQFENGVRNSISSLEKLKSALKFDTGADGFDQAQKSADSLIFSLEQGLDSIIHRYSTLGIIGARILENLTDKAMDGIARVTDQLKSGGMNRALNLEQAKFTLKGLDVAWDETLKTGISQNINDAVKGTAYGLDAAAKAASQLVASNVEVGDSMYHALRGIAGVASMTNSTYDEIAHIFTRIAGNGRMMGEDLASFSTRGLNAAATLGKVLGKTEEQIRDLASDGAITFEIFSEAMFQAFGEQAAKANDTFNGAMSNVNAALSRIGAKFAAPYIEYMRPVLVELIGFFDAIGKSITPLVDKVSGTMKTLSDLTVNTLKGITGQLVDLNDANKPVAESTNWVQPFAQGLANIIDGIRGAITLFHDFWEAAFPSVSGNPLLDFANSFREATSVFKYVFTGEIDAGSKAVKEFIAVIGDHTSVIEDFKATVTAVAEVVGTLYSKLKLVWQKILQPLAMRILPAILKYIRGIAEEASTIVKLIFGNGVFDTAVDVIGKGMTKLSDLALSLFGATDKVSEEIEDTARHTEKTISKTADNIEDTTGKAVDKSKEKLREYHKVVNDVINWDKDANGDWEQSLFDSGYTKEQIDEIKELVERVTNEGWEIFIDVDSNADEAAEELERLKELAEKLYHTNNELVDKIYNETVDSVNSTFKSVAYADRSIDYMHDTFFDRFYDNLVNSGFDPEEARALATEHSKIFFDTYIDETEEAYNEKMQHALPEKTHGEEIREARDRMTGWTSDPRKVYNDRVNKAFDQAFDKINARYKDKVLSDIDIDKMTQEAFDESYQYLLKFGFTEEEAYEASLLNRKFYYDRFVNISEEAWDEIRGNAKDTEEFGETVSIADRLGSILSTIIGKLKQVKTFLVDKIIIPAGEFLINIGSIAWGTITDTVQKVAEWVGAIWDKFSQSDIFGQIGNKIGEIKGKIEPIATSIQSKIQPFLEKLKNIKLPEVDPGVVEKIAGALENIGQFFLNGLNGAQEKIGAVSDKLKEFLVYDNNESIDIWASIEKATDAFVQYIGEKVGEFKAYIASFFINPETQEFDIFKPLKDLGGEAIEFVIGKFGELQTAIGGLVVVGEGDNIDIWATLQNAATTAFGAISQSISDFKDDLSELPGKISEFFSSLFDFGDDAKEIIPNEFGEMPVIFKELGNKGGPVLTNISEKLSGFFEAFKNVFYSENEETPGIFNTIEKKATDVFGAIGEKAEKIKEDLIGIFTTDDGKIDIFSAIQKAFETFVETVSNGYTELSGKVAQAISDEFAKITGIQDFNFNPDEINENDLTPIGKFIVDAYKLVQDIKAEVETIIEKIKGIKIDDIPVISDISGWFEELKNIDIGEFPVVEAITTAINDISGALETATGWFSEFIGMFADNETVNAITSAIEPNIMKAMDSGGGSISGSRTATLTPEGEFISIEEEAKKLSDVTLGDIMSGIIEQFNAFIDLVQKLPGFLGEAFDGIVSTYNEYKGKAGEAFDKVTEWVTNVGTGLTDVWGVLKETFGPIAQASGTLAVTAGENIANGITGFAEGLSENPNMITEAIATAIVKGLTFIKVILAKVKEVAEWMIENPLEAAAAIDFATYQFLIFEVASFIKDIRNTLSGGGYLNQLTTTLFGGINDIGNAFWSIAKGIAVIVTSMEFMKGIKDEDAEHIEMFMNRIVAIVGALAIERIITSITTLIGKWKAVGSGSSFKSLHVIFDGMGAIFMQMAVGVLAIAEGAKIVGEMNPKQFEQASTFLAAVSGFATLFTILSDLKKTIPNAGTAGSVLSGVGSMLSGLSGIGLLVGGIGGGIYGIAEGLSTLKDLTPEDISKASENMKDILIALSVSVQSVIAEVGAIDLIGTAVSAKTGGTFKFDGLTGVALLIGGLGAGMFGIAESVKVFAEMDATGDEITAAIENFKTVLTEVVDAVEDVLKAKGIWDTVSNIPGALAMILGGSGGGAGGAGGSVEKGGGIIGKFKETLGNVFKFIKKNPLEAGIYGATAGILYKWITTDSEEAAANRAVLTTDVIDNFWSNYKKEIQDNIQALVDKAPLDEQDELNKALNEAFEHAQELDVTADNGAVDNLRKMKNALETVAEGYGDVGSALQDLYASIGEDYDNVGDAGALKEKIRSAIIDGMDIADQYADLLDQNTEAFWSFMEEYNTVRNEYADGSIEQLNALDTLISNYQALAERQQMINNVYDTVFDVMRNEGETVVDAAAEAEAITNEFIRQLEESGGTLNPIDFLLTYDSIEAAQGKGFEVASKFETGIGEGKDGITSEWRGIVQAIQDESESAQPVAHAHGALVSQNFGEGVVENQETAKQSGTTIKDAVITGLSDPEGTVYQQGVTVGANATQGVIDGANSRINSVIQTAQNTAVTYLTTLANGLQEKSPSKATGQIGIYAVEGFVNNILERLPIVRDSGTELANTFMDGLNTAADMMGNVLDPGFVLDPTIKPVLDVGSIQNGIYDLNNEFANFTSGMADSAQFSFNKQQMAQIEAAQPIPPENYTEQLTALRTDINTLNDTLLKRPIVLDSGEIVGGISGLVDQSLGMVSMRRNRGL